MTTDSTHIVTTHTNPYGRIVKDDSYTVDRAGKPTGDADTNAQFAANYKSATEVAHCRVNTPLHEKSLWAYAYGENAADKARATIAIVSAQDEAFKESKPPSCETINRKPSGNL